MPSETAERGPGSLKRVVRRRRCRQCKGLTHPACMRSNGLCSGCADATVVRDGYTVPLIGIPREAVLEECDCCGETIGLSQSHFTGSQVLCSKCMGQPPNAAGELQPPPNNPK